jgi:PAS domain S-box-containing protein
MEPALTPEQHAQIKREFEQAGSMPYRVHVTDQDGKFLFANAEAREFFGLGDDPLQHNISQMYEDERERRYVLRELKKVTPGEWRRAFTVVLKVKGKRQKVRFSSKPFFDQRGEIVAMLNMTDPMNWVERFAEFESEIGVGLFEIDKFFKVAECNAFLANMLGYEHSEELKGRHIKDFLWENGAPLKILEALKNSSKLEKYPLKLKREDGGLVLAEMSCTALSLDHDEITRIKGVLRDTTFKVFYDDLPVGLFLISKNEEDKDVISQVNDTFIKMHGYEKPSEVLRKLSSMFESDPVTSASYKKALEKALKENKPLLDHYTKVRGKAGNLLDVVVNVRFLPDQNGQMRVGAVYDLTENVGKHLRILEADFSALLHTYIATMNGVLDTLQYVIKAQGQDTLNDAKQLDTEAAGVKIAGSQKHLGSLLLDLEKVANERKSGINHAATLLRYWRKMSGANANIHEDDNASWQRRNLIEMGKAFENIKNAGLPKELLRNIRFEMNEMLRLTNVTSLNASYNELIKRMPEFDYFEKYLRSEETDMREWAEENVISILNDEINYIRESAAKRKIAIVVHNREDTIMVRCNKTSLSRAFQSLLNNAVKYSWHKGGDNRPWVDVRVSKRLDAQKKDIVEIVIENWGVAIRKEELENDELFKFGKRGKIAEVEGRSGTGIGLYDAWNIISKHEGSLRLTSDPIFGNPPTLYTKPFITKAFVTLPISKIS